MTMNELALSYIADIDQELVVLQGISAQISRIRQSAPRLRRKSTGMPSVELLHPANELTQTNIRKSMPQIKTARPHSSKTTSSSTSSIPLRRLLPGNRSSSLARMSPRSTASMPTPPMSPASLEGSINPRFSDAHIEYFGRDCVIHNGTHTVDIAMEFATQRAAPRLVSFSSLA
ncbi:hypothetical protein H4R22_001183 [Coemansia sp. RSA 1290]|nr:hypothetical protein LPJ68_002247 [Coemansia sp. RSA 1086]KAJ1750311.1 hypothetical protein LPJ79_003010 [Coemansia sp. RSA 1821]KAJ2632541.1 hypothetical protein H4R22_001183 [Coemansia sp. RSA 1290]KAJ2648974.1 hypothetical protein IWW40_003518 [Coemansia sp. RSA 1250]KAJ2671340.1 hypothetical protein IWW42_003463 [Coemansia sp. RSA 1085]